MDVRFYIGRWEFMRANTPQGRLSKSQSDARRKIAESCWASMSKETWEAFICALGYSELRGVDPNQLKIQFSLRNVSGKMDERIAIELLASRPANKDFLRYSSEFRTISSNSFLKGVRLLGRKFDHFRLLSNASTIDILHECILTCRDNPDPETCVSECMEKSNE